MPGFPKKKGTRGGRRSESKTIAMKIVEHLKKWPERDSYLARFENTQDGVGEAVGISRAHASVELKKLRLAGILVMRMGRVNGHRMLRKVYFVSPGVKTCVQPSMPEMSLALRHIEQAQRILAGLQLRDASLASEIAMREADR